MVELDAHIGAIMDKVRALGLEKNTFVFYTTDNGAWQDVYPDAGYTPFRGTKGTVREGGNRVPAIAWMPGKIEAEKSNHDILGGLDLMATFAALAGVALPEKDREGKPIIFDSIDMSPVLFGTGKSARTSWFYFTEDELSPGAMRVGNYKAVFNLRGDDGVQTGGLAVDTNLGWKGPSKYVATVPQIFDLWQDPQERYDIFMNNFTERTWTMIPITEAITELMKTYIEVPAAEAPEHDLHRADHALQLRAAPERAGDAREGRHQPADADRQLGSGRGLHQPGERAQGAFRFLGVKQHLDPGGVPDHEDLDVGGVARDELDGLRRRRILVAEGSEGGLHLDADLVRAGGAVDGAESADAELPHDLAVHGERRMEARSLAGGGHVENESSLSGRDRRQGRGALGRRGARCARDRGEQERQEARQAAAHPHFVSAAIRAAISRVSAPSAALCAATRSSNEGDATGCSMRNSWSTGGAIRGAPTTRSSARAGPPSGRARPRTRARRGARGSRRGTDGSTG